MHQLLLASLEILLLWIFILLTIFQFRKINTTAAWMNVPYLAWVSFAMVLTFAIYFIN